MIKSNLYDYRSREAFRQSLVTKAQSLPSCKEIIPTSWIQLAHFIDYMKGNNSNELKRLFTITVDELFALIQSSPLLDKPVFATTDELRAGLNFVHSLGLVFYFSHSSTLKDTVFMHPQWVADVLKCFIRHDMEKVFCLLIFI